MSNNGLLIAIAAGILTFIIAGDLHPLVVTNVLLGLIWGKMTEKR
ncbi:hypothetical protein [Ammoniphilus resinae]|uniref:Uncharacterized protein n=1 Tax=Ammoniphilus resinae TaxID=861532 RepID=A0ABS4GIV5_9BACL|nr:hypothetical protein [Ammoniphilus resinae]MBP1930087.1 hypothetical protein [Ammoniphilus resinae]